MENLRLLNNGAVIEEKPKDFINETILEEDNTFQKNINKRKLTLIGLASLYMVLLIASFTFLT